MPNSQRGARRNWLKVAGKSYMARLPTQLLRATLFGSWQLGVDQRAPFAIDPRKSALLLVFAIFERSNSMASTADSGVRTLRRTQTRLRSSFGSRSSSFRVPLF